MHSVFLDFATAFRFISRRRAASAAVILTMALALLANTTAFAVLHAFLYGNLSVPDADRVVTVPATKILPGQGRIDFSDAYPNYLLLKTNTHSFSALGCVLTADVNWAQQDETRRLEGVRATASFFDVMQSRPLIGRLFTAREEGPHAAPVALISHRLWRSAFNSDRGVIGRNMTLNGTPHTVIGIMPQGFVQPAAGGAGIDVWLPFDLPENMWASVTGARQINNYGRLAPGVTIAAADADLRAFAVHAAEVDPVNKDWGWRVQKLRDQLLDGSGKVVVFVQCGALVLLLLAICNLVSVLIAWAAERERETAVRLALGATTWRIIRQSVIQSFLLVGVGGLTALIVTQFALPALQHLNPNPSLGAMLSNVKIDWSTIGFTLLLIAGTGILVGVFPAMQTRPLSLETTLRSQSRGGSANPAALRWQKAMVTFQAAISVVILVCAALAAIGLEKVSRVNLGFADSNRITFRIELPEPAFAKHEQRAQFAQSLQANLANEAALKSYGLTTTLPVGDGQWGGSFVVQRASGEFSSDPVLFHYRRISSGYPGAMGIPLLEGRMLDERDRADSPQVAVVSKALVDKQWPGQSAIGRKIRRATPADSPTIEIVGVVGNIHDAGAAIEAGQTVYVPYAQISLRRVTVVLHGRGSVADTVAAGRRALRLTSPDLAAFGIEKLEVLSWQANALPRLQVVLFASFAVVAMAITGLGTYGVMSQLVSIREKELAIRAALGATRATVLRLVLRQNAELAIAGTLAGTVLAWLGSRWLQAQLTSFDASSFWPFAIVASAVLILTQVSGLIPAYRAMTMELRSVLSAA